MTHPSYLLSMNCYRLVPVFAYLGFMITITLYFSTIGSAWGEEVRVISTRSHFDQIGNPIPSKPSYEPFPFDFGSIGCSQETIIYIHGVWTAKDRADEVNKKMFENAPEIFDRLRLSLETVDYKFPVIGFSWDSDTEISPEGWDNAIKIARNNGPKLAQFVLDLQENCPQTKIRLIAHSLGARVVLSGLHALNNNELWKDNKFKIASVDLLGAAIDDDEVSKNSLDVISSNGLKSAYGKVIEKQVTHFYNLFDSEDDALEPGAIGWYFPFLSCAYLYYSCFNLLENQPVYYPYFEQDLALGQSGSQSNISPSDKPRNYMDIPISRQIPNFADADADGECDLTFNHVCTINHIGDNHLGYVGFRDLSNNNTIKNNGAIDIVVNTFRNPS